MKVTIVGGGASGLFCAFQLLKQGIDVDLYEQMSGVGKKFLVAGKGGLNLTHSEDLELFITRYGKDKNLFKNILSNFSPKDLRNWCSEIGVETFVGSSGRVFPKSFKAAEILRLWTEQLKMSSNFNLYLNHQLTKIIDHQTLLFKYKIENEMNSKNNKEDFQEKIIKSNVIVFSLGGASWKRTGSNGKWASLFKDHEIKIENFLPMNCGFETKWSSNFLKRVEAEPLKNISISIDNQTLRGEAMLTQYGIEGSAIYALSSVIRNKIIKNNQAEIQIDLKPDITEAEVRKRLSKVRGKQSLSNHIRKILKLSGIYFSLIKELTTKEELFDMNLLAGKIKNLEIKLTKTRPIDEAISTSGGVSLQEIDQNFMLKKLQNCFVLGEMLDWEAPTGGYLLQGCFSNAFVVAKYISKMNKSKK